MSDEQGTTMQTAQGGTKPAPAPVHQRRMTLASVTTGIQKKPLRLLVNGTDGVGKSTFGSQAPAPIFLDAEDRSGRLDVARFPRPEAWEDVLDAVRELIQGEHQYKTLVVDTVDWIEPLVWRHAVESYNRSNPKAKADNIEEVGGGFGKGYAAAVDVWRGLLAALERLQREKWMNVVLLGHAFIKPFKNPEGPDFERYVLKMHDKAAALIREWCDGVYFAQYETFAEEDKRKRVRGISSGARLMHTQRTAAYDAKDTYGLPDTLTFSWAEFEAALAGGDELKRELLEAIRANAKALGPEGEAHVAAALTRAGGDVAKLKQLHNWIHSKLALRAEETVQ